MPCKENQIKMKALMNSNLEGLDGEAHPKRHYSKRKEVDTKEDGSMHESTVKKENKIQQQEYDNSQGSKKQRLTWTPFLEQKFQDALRQLNRDAVPSKITKVMNVRGLHRHHVASHLQKYRLRLKKQLRNNAAYKEEEYYSTMSHLAPNAVLPKQQGPLMMQPSCNILNFSSNPPLQMPPLGAFPWQISLTITPTNPLANIGHFQASLDGLVCSFNTQAELSPEASPTGMTAHLNQNNDTSFYDTFGVIPNTTGEDVAPSEVIQQAQMDTGLTAEASNNSIVTENNTLMADSSWILDFDISDIDFTCDELPSFETPMGTNQFQSFDNNGQQPTSVEVASTSKSMDIDAFAKELEKLLTWDEESAKMNSQPPPTDES